MLHLGIVTIAEIKIIDLSETPPELRREIINNFMADKPRYTMDETR